MAALHFPSFLVAAGLLFLLMPMMTWLVLMRQQSSRALTLWCGGSLLMGVGVWLLALRPVLPDWVSYPIANLALTFGIVARIESFKVELNKSSRTVVLFMLPALTILIFELIRQGLGDNILRLQYIATIYAIGFLYTGSICRRFSQKFSNRSALWVAGANFALGAALALRVAEVTWLANSTADGVESTPAALLVGIIAVFDAVVSNIGYMAMKLEQKQVRLTKAEDQLGAILKTTKDGFFIVDLSGRFVRTNKVLCDMLGRTRDELLSLRVEDIDVHFSHQALHEKFRQISEIGFERFETQHKTSEGRLIDVEISVTRLSQGQLIGFVRDITLRKQFTLELERKVLQRTEELATARAEAESANAVKTRLMANLSHEMRTPLNGILGYAEFAKAKLGVATQEDMGKYLDGISISGERMKQLVESLLGLVEHAWNEHTRLAENELTLIEPVAFASQCISLVERRAYERRQIIVLDNQATITAIQGDPIRLRQVLEHLLANAISYSPEQATITVRIADKPGNNDTDKRLAFQVIDQGCGIPEKEMRAIFEPFYESTRTATGAGKTGLGLPLSRSIVKRHKGSLTVSNRPEGGAMFEVVLPRYQ